MGYLTREDIPSSAVEVTASNYQSVVGNVIYLPIDTYDSTARNIQIKGYEQTAYVKELLGYVSNGLYGSTALDLQAGATKNYMYFYNGLRSSTSSVTAPLISGFNGSVREIVYIGIITDIDTESSGGLRRAYFASAYATLGDAQYFLRVKFKNDIQISANNDSFLQNHPVLIDNE